MQFYEDGKRIRPTDIHKNQQILHFDQLNQTPNRLCKGKCIQFKALKPANGNRYASGQSRCQVCEIFLTEQGVIDNLRCRCCNFRVRNKPRNSFAKERYYKNIENTDIDSTEPKTNDDTFWLENSTETSLEEQENNYVKKSTPIYEEVDDSVKTYYELKEFLNSKIRLEANYPLVMLKELLEYGRLHKGEIADSLAYFNNKDSSDINSVKYYLKIPVYDVLLNHGFVIIDKKSRIPYYIINVKVTDFQKLELLEYLGNSIQKYNQEHNIPDNEHPDANNVGSIDWSDYPELLFDDKSQNTESNSISSKSFWIWSVTPTNWEILKIKNVWGSRILKEKISQVVKPGDFVAFYVIGTNSFKGAYQFDGSWYDSPGKTWDDDLEPTGELRYKSQIKITPVCNGDAKLSELHEKMDLFKNKPTNIRNLILQSGSGYPSNNQQSLTSDDFSVLIDELNNSTQPDYDNHKTVSTDKNIQQVEEKEQNSKSRWMKKLLGISNVGVPIIKKHSNEIPLSTPESKIIHDVKSIIKECPRCHISISGIADSLDFNNQIEEKFGFRQRDVNNPQSKTSQSYCRKCRSSQNLENEEMTTLQDEFQKSQSLKIFEYDNNLINIKHCNVISTEIIQKDQQLTNDDLMRIFGVGNMGGIRYSSKNNVIILCDTKSGHYDDIVDKDFQIIYYTGEGQKGDQTLTGGNQRIVNSKITPMFYFIEVPQELGQKKRGALDNIYKFVGRVKYTKHVFKTENDINGTPRQVIKFLLEVIE